MLILKPGLTNSKSRHSLIISHSAIYEVVFPKNYCTQRYIFNNIVLSNKSTTQTIQIRNAKQSFLLKIMFPPVPSFSSDTTCSPRPNMSVNGKNVIKYK